MRIVIVFLLTTTLSLASNKDAKTNPILEKFSTVCKSIEKLEYTIQRIDTMANGKKYLANGYAFISKEPKDKNLGYYFYSNHKELNWQSIYDGNNCFEINNNDKTYKLVKSVNGTSGHQFVHRIAELIFFPDKKYDRVKISNETKNTYTIELIFDNEPVKDFKKIIVIDKNSFLPIRYSFGGIQFGNKYSHNFIISNLKINDEVETSIEKLKLKLASYEMLTEKEENKINLIGSEAIVFNLPELNNPARLSSIINNKVTLLDFWEVWCGYCLKSMPEIQKLSVKYSDKLSIIGIVSENPEYAKQVVMDNNLTFKTLVGNNEIKKKYGANSFPRYFLINKNGIIIKEYTGFSDQIEKDIIKIAQEN